MAGALPARVEVAIVGAGLSGLVAARRLEAAGVAEVVVVEARERVGGRLLGLGRPGGSDLEGGGEFTGPGQERLRGLAAELGARVVELPGARARDEGAADVRLFGQERHLEREPFEADRAAAAAHAAALAALHGLAADVPPAVPWSAPDAKRLDALTLGAWLDANVDSAPVRAALAAEFAPLGGSSAELSLLFVLWTIASAGGRDGHEGQLAARLEPGPSHLVRRLAADLATPPVLGVPVRTVHRDEEGVELTTATGSVRASVAILALAPSQCAKLEFLPRLPVLRERAQDRWLQGHGGKVFAVYEDAWWRAEGLTGNGSGHPLVPFLLDVSRDDGEGILCGLICETGDLLARLAPVLDDADAFRAAALEALAAYLGPRAADPRELRFHLWHGDRWSDGCGTGLPPGVLATCGPSLRPPAGRVVWAGAETGIREHMEGAVEAGERAAAEAVALLGRRPVLR